MSNHDENLYVVMEVGWEYNDQYYYRPESMGGLPVKIFSSEDLALMICKELEFEFFKSYADSGYYGVLAEILLMNDMREDVNEELREITGDNNIFIDRSGVLNILDSNKLTPDLWYEIIWSRGACQYEVIPVKFEV